MKDSVDIYGTYEILDQIGRGSYASVHKAINRQTGEICAIKKIPSMTSELNNLITEIGIMSNCKCKNIVRFLASNCANREVLIVMEYCCGGSVKDVMRQLGRTMTIEQITVILRDVLNGLDYLHATNKIHRDVKAANILLNEEGVAKLGDFGVSEPLDTSARKRTIIGTLLWLPPEVINHDPNYSTAIDIWSLGITIIEMGDGQPPYSDLEQSAALKEIANLDKPAPSFKDISRWPQNLTDFVSLCLEKDATKRKSAKQLLDYEIMQKAPSNDVIKKLVAEVCTSTVNQTESSLFRRYKSLLKENIRLCSIYEERRMKVIKVDQMIDSHRALDKEFIELLEGSMRKNARINDTRKQLKLFEDEIQKLERERSELLACLEEKRNRKSEIEDQMNKIKEKHDDELRRRARLRALEG